ncbi:MAG: DUF2764 domain-containing protein [Candidatus Omnitrophica bacterium]|nr:DUF2764 domain-containing protein [Candidatus Omnitrophota bacterium]MBU1871957.1 DUF2764 domain-containing protein [Candidatus Omnitrophota bacterium]
MDKYYYLISSLPLLKFYERPAISKEDFLAESKKWLSAGDFVVLSALNVNHFIADKKDTPLLKQWKDFEYSIRSQLSLFRTARGKNQEYKMQKDINEIIQAGNNPLEIEQALLFFRWGFLEEQEIEHFFDLDFLIIYCLKLQILERLFTFDNEKGKQRFEELSTVAL